MRWRHLHLRGAVHLISRLRRQLPLIGEALGCAPPKPPLPGEVARRKPRRRGRCRFDTTSQSAFGCQHPYPFCPCGTFPPDRGNRPLKGEPWRLQNNKNPMQKGADRKIRSTPSIDCKYSKATAHKLGVSYQAARSKNSQGDYRVERRLRSRASPECRGRKHQTVTQRPFLPYLFPRKGKDMAAGGASETTTTERAAASDVSYPLCSFLPFQTAN